MSITERGWRWVEKGVGCELCARPECSPCSPRSQRPLGVARRARIPKLPRVASRATPPVGAEEGLGGRCARFFGSACVTERPARRETRRTIIPMRPSSAEGLVDLPHFGIYALARSSRESRISRISESRESLESRISRNGMHFLTYGTNRARNSTSINNFPGDLSRS